MKKHCEHQYYSGRQLRGGVRGGRDRPEAGIYVSGAHVVGSMFRGRRFIVSLNFCILVKILCSLQFLSLCLLFLLNLFPFKYIFGCILYISVYPPCGSYRLGYMYMLILNFCFLPKFSVFYTIFVSLFVVLLNLFSFKYIFGCLFI